MVANVGRSLPRPYLGIGDRVTAKAEILDLASDVIVGRPVNGEAVRADRADRTYRYERRRALGLEDQSGSVAVVPIAR